jgi:hypothetical protein
MFSFLSKGSGPEVTDKVWLSTAAMQAGIAQWLTEHAGGLVIAWFRNDYAALVKALPEGVAGRVMLAERITSADVTPGRQLLMAGHYPLQTGESAFAEGLGLKKLLVYSALDSPLFSRFGGAKIIEAARGMGVKEHEGIEHFLVSSAIKKTQSKIVDKVTNELSAHSEEEWMRLNLSEA